jgi:hypothetical protein
VGPTAGFGHFGEEIILLTLPGLEPRFLVCPARSPGVTTAFSHSFKTVFEYKVAGEMKNGGCP